MERQSSIDEKYKDDSFDDCIVKLLKIPIQLLFIEKLEVPEDSLEKDITRLCYYLVFFKYHLP